MYPNKTGKRALAEHAPVRLSPWDAARPHTASAANLNRAGMCATKPD